MAGSLDEGRTRLVDMREVGLLVMIDMQGTAEIQGLQVSREQAVIWLRTLADSIEAKIPVEMLACGCVPPCEGHRDDE